MTNRYLPIKQFVLRSISDRASAIGDLIPSQYWIDFASNFSYVYDLNDSECDRIRFHTFHLTSDLYLTYYFANDSFIRLLDTGYEYFAVRGGLTPCHESDLGIGVETNLGRVSHDLLRYLGVVIDLFSANLLDKITPKLVLEIGGGYGGLARAHLLQNPKLTYIILDLEETLFFSAVYLSKQLDPSRVHLVSEPLSPAEILPGHVYIVPQSKIDLLNQLKFDYAISQQSLQEMTHNQVMRYLNWVSTRSQYLYSCNVFDHGVIATNKGLVTALTDHFSTLFGAPIWQGDTPNNEERFGDNHLPRAVYQTNSRVSGSKSA